jgi:hypothetical protein
MYMYACHGESTLFLFPTMVSKFWKVWRASKQASIDIDNCILVVERPPPSGIEVGDSFFFFDCYTITYPSGETRRGDGEKAREQESEEERNADSDVVGTPVLN